MGVFVYHADKARARGNIFRYFKMYFHANVVKWTETCRAIFKMGAEWEDSILLLSPASCTCHWLAVNFKPSPHHSSLSRFPLWKVRLHALSCSSYMPQQASVYMLNRHLLVYEAFSCKEGSSDLKRYHQMKTFVFDAGEKNAHYNAKPVSQQPLCNSQWAQLSLLPYPTRYSLYDVGLCACTHAHTHTQHTHTQHTHKHTNTHTHTHTDTHTHTHTHPSHTKTPDLRARVLSQNKVSIFNLFIYS